VAGSNVIAARLVVDDRAAEAARPAIRRLRQHLVALAPHLIFPLHEGALVSVLGKVGIGAAGQDVSPRGFEVGARQASLCLDESIRTVRFALGHPTPLLF
jgi:hypothetical protein